MSDETTPSLWSKIGWLIGTAAALSIFVVVGVYSARMTHDYKDFNQKRADERYATLAKVRAEANQTLTTADWVDQGKQIVRIPIDEAMAKEVDTLKGKPAAIGAEIPGAVPATNAPSTNAPVAKPQPPAASIAAPAASTNAAPTATPPPAQEKK